MRPLEDYIEQPKLMRQAKRHVVHPRLHPRRVPRRRPARCVAQGGKPVPQELPQSIS